MPDQSVKNYTQSTENGSISTYESGIFTSTFPQEVDPRFGNGPRPPGTNTLQDGGQYLTYSFTETPSLSDPSDPFSLTSLVSSWTTNNKTKQSLYTASTNSTVDTTPEGRTTTTVFNSNSLPLSVQKASLTPVTFTYDSRGRIEEVAQGTNRVTAYSYNSSGYISSITDPLNQTTNYTYDLAGRKISQTLPDNRVVSFTYDANGNLASITPPGKPTHSMTYNDFDLISTYLPPTIQAPSTVSSTYYYDNDRKLIQVVRPDAQTIDWNYNTTTGVLDSIVLPNGSRTFSWYQGKVVGSYSEDFVGRGISFSGTKVTNDSSYTGNLYYNLSYTYNSDILLNDETLSIGSYYISIPQTYDKDNRLMSVGNQTFTRSSTTGSITKIIHGNTEQNFSYSANFDELASHLTTFNSNSVYSESMVRDNLGRIIEKVVQYGSSTSSEYDYFYDSTGRLETVTLNGNPLSSYSYDTNSNRTSQTISSQTKTATYDDQDRLLTFGTKSFTYNLNGEITSMSDSSTSSTTNYTYDVLGNLKSVVLPTKTINYHVDSHNRRTTKLDGTSVEGHYLWNLNDQLVGLADASGALIVRYVYGSKAHVPDYMIMGSDEYQIISNHLGSPVVVINVATGVIEQEVKYDEFGNILSDTNPGFTAFGYAGCLYDTDTKLCRFGARDYDASIGRWLSKDPIRFEGGDTNLYGYVFQDPINLIDPEGTMGAKIVEFVVKQFVKRTTREGVECITNVDPFGIPDAGKGSDIVPGYPKPSCNPALQSCYPQGSGTINPIINLK